MATKNGDVVECSRILFEGFVTTRGWRGAATKKAVRDSIEDKDARIVVDKVLQTFSVTPKQGGDSFEGPLSKVKQWFPKSAKAE